MKISVILVGISNEKKIRMFTVYCVFLDQLTGAADGAWNQRALTSYVLVTLMGLQGLRDVFFAGVELLPLQCD